MHPLIDFIKATLPGLSSETLGILERAFLKKEIQKGEHLLRQGDICRNLYFLVNGITRSYSIKDGTDITTWFGFKNEFITSFTSFFPEEPSYESIELLSDGTLYQISRYQFFEMRRQSIEIERVVSHFVRMYTIQLEKRLFHIQTSTAAEKYQLILEQEPHLIQLISNKHLASYLGITRETLSRIRAKSKIMLFR